MFIISPCLPVFDRRHLDDWSLYPGNHLQYLLSSVLPPPEVSQDISQVSTCPCQLSLTPVSPRLLLLLGLVDTVHLVTSLITFSLPTLAPALGESASIIRWSLPLAQVSAGPRSQGILMMKWPKSSMVMSVYMTISMTVERYLSVVHPLYTLRNRSWFWNINNIKLCSY